MYTLGRVSAVAELSDLPMIQVPLVFYDVSTFFVAKLGGEGDVACKSRIFAIAPVAVHTIRSLFEGEVAGDARFPEEG